MPGKNIAFSLILGISIFGIFSLNQPCWGQTLVQSTVDTRLQVALRVGEGELSKVLPSTWQTMLIPGGPFKGANFFLVFIDSFLVQDAQGKPDMGGMSHKVVFAVPAKHAQTGEIATVVIGGFTADVQEVPGPYRNFSHATIRRDQTLRWARIEAGAGEDFWEVRNTRGGIIELKIQYQRALPSRAKAEQKIYSATEPNFFRIYRLDMGTDIIKSVPAGMDRVQNYQFRIAVPELSKLFDGTEQLVGIATIPLYVRQIFLP